MARAGLTVDRLVDAGVEMADTEGFEAVTVSALARHFDVRPARVRITGSGGVTEVIGLMRQNRDANGLIQAATADLDFDDVFTDGGSVWRGSLNVDFLAPNEPYTAFDYVELSGGTWQSFGMTWERESTRRQRWRQSAI